MWLTHTHTHTHTQIHEGLRTEQSSREEEQLTHAEMLKELQALIATERDEKEAFKLQLQESNQEMERLCTQIANNKCVCVCV